MADACNGVSAAMKWGLRKLSLRKRIAARTSWKRYVRHSLGLKVPRGWGWLTNPRKAAYNRLYRRTTFGLDDLFRRRRRGSPQAGCFVLFIAAIAFVVSSIGLFAASGQGAADPSGMSNQRVSNSPEVCQ